MKKNTGNLLSFVKSVRTSTTKIILCSLEDEMSSICCAVWGCNILHKAVYFLRFLIKPKNLINKDFGKKKKSRHSSETSDSDSNLDEHKGLFVSEKQKPTFLDT